MNRQLAYFISALFHPVFVNLAGLCLLFFFFPALAYGIPLRLKWYYISYLFLTTSVIPLVLVFSLRITGRIQSISMELKEERKLPYLVTFLMFVFNFYNLSKYAVPPLLMSWILASGGIILLVMLVNFFYKISLHAAAMGSFTGVVATAAFQTGAELRLELMCTLLLCGLVGSSRLSLKAHDTAQIYLGYLAGLILMLLIL